MIEPVSNSTPEPTVERLRTVERTCHVCGRDLREEPAIKRVEGLTCFPCCCVIDKQWDEKYAPKMKKIEKVRSILKSTGFLVGFIAVIGVDFHDLTYPLIGLCGGCFLVAYGLKRSLKHACPNPPWSSVNPMYRCPEIVLDEATESMKIIELIKHRYSWRHKGGLCDGSMQKYLSQHFSHILRDRSKQHDDRYPENWENIRNYILSRDKNQCRICGKLDDLHVHHVKPISKGGSHTAQNLITLCKDCHASQDYYMHKRLIEVSRAFNRKMVLKPQ